LRCEIIASQPIDVRRGQKDSAARKLFALSASGGRGGILVAGTRSHRRRAGAAELVMQADADLPDDALFISPDLQGLQHIRPLARTSEGLHINRTFRL
jgi:hypothetical protein